MFKAAAIDASESRARNISKFKSRNGKMSLKLSLHGPLHALTFNKNIFFIVEPFALLNICNK